MIQAQSQIRVRYAETDAMGIVHHGSYIPWLETARVQLLDDLGYPYRKLEQDGVVLPVIEVHLRYRTPCRFDDRLVVTARVGTMPTARLRIDYQIHRDETLICEATSHHGFVTREGKPVRPPEKLHALFRHAFVHAGAEFG